MLNDIYGLEMTENHRSEVLYIWWGTYVTSKATLAWLAYRVFQRTWDGNWRITLYLPMPR